MRVASRRLRTGMQVFKACLPVKNVRKWEDAIRRITHILGKARDLDVQIIFLEQCSENDLDARYKPGYRRLMLRLKQRRAKRQKKIIKTLQQLEENKILQEMIHTLTESADRSESQDLFTPSLYQKASKAIKKRLEEFLVYEKYLDDPEKADKLHAMRIAGKHLRYTLEIFAPLYQEKMTPFIEIMQQIQDLLGDFHDNEVWLAWLPKFVKKERKRIEDYFGNTGPLKRLLPGIDHFYEDREKAHDACYQAFITFWQSLQKENTWENLSAIIAAPIYLETALEETKESHPNAASPSEATSQVKPTETTEN